MFVIVAVHCISILDDFALKDQNSHENYKAVFVLCPVGMRNYILAVGIDLNTIDLVSSCINDLPPKSIIT